MSSDLLRAVLARNRFHLVFQTELQLLQSHFFKLLLVGQMRQSFQLVQPSCVIAMRRGELAILRICLHQMRFELFLCVPFHIGAVPPSEVATPSRWFGNEARWVIFTSSVLRSAAGPR